MKGRRLVVAGTHSGVGKTTVALALMAALRRRGLTVQPFKAGPDFIDPGHHTAVCGRPSRNLDTWMLGDDVVRALFARGAAGADVSVIEGVMGLFDGRSAEDPRGSTAHLAKLLDAPVLLVVDAAGAAASVAAVVKGFAELDPGVRVAAVLCNRVAGPRHYAYLEPAIRRHTPVAPAGWLPRRPEWHIPERHLGLVTRDDLGGGAAADLGARAQALEATANLDLLLELSAGQTPASGGRQPPDTLNHPGADAPRSPVCRVGVARDAAFCFYYQDNLDLLKEAGAELVPFSPLRGPELPAALDLVYLGGGYPELHAERLAANTAMTDSLRAYHRRGGRIYAECGGLMYCCRELVRADGRAFPMLDLLPARTFMQGRLAALGYVTWRADGGTLLGPPGTEARGHEFHYSRLEPLGPLSPAARLQREGEAAKPDGFTAGGLLAGYAHLHFASSPSAAASLVSAQGCSRQGRSDLAEPPSE
jgi:cobyrinic acid a,c-diamide synthase